MTYKFLFLVGSALNHFQSKDFSVFSTEQRFHQTLETIKSIKEKDPTAYICIYEGSETPIDDHYREKFLEVSDLFLECYDDSVIKVLYENLNRDPVKITYGKSMLECRCIQLVLSHMIKNNVFNDVQRIFKLTGRYTLNENFEIQDYQSKLLSNKYVLKVYDYENRFENPENLYANLYGCKGSIVTGMWSFDKLLFGNVMEVLQKSFEYMEKAIQYTCGIDIEHSLYHFIDKNNILNVDTLGVNVVKGMSKEIYSL
jgi:hypothetical protein